MDCPRCDGNMVSEVFEDIKDDTGNMKFPGYRCLTCGEILDPVIMANRQNRPFLHARNRKLMAFSRA